jgi:peptidoglycan/LPS O-acetylase OafA/YrhL
MNQIKCLTSLRFFAATMIVVFHSVNAFRIADNSKITFPLAQGVSFFFVLSGFILTYVYPSLNGAHRIRDFYVARIARIWPAHLAAFLLLLGLLPSAGWVWNGVWEIVAANLLLVHGWVPSASYYFSFNSVSWSISTEAFFYLVFPFLICRWNRSWWWKLLCTAGFVATMLRLSDFLKLPPYNAANLSAVTAHGIAYISPLVRILEFVYGMVVASLCLRCRQLKIVTSLPGWLWTVLELAALSAVLLSGWNGTRLLSSLFDGRKQYAFAVYAGACGSFPAFGLLIGVLSFERGMVSWFLSATPLVILGEISYSVYLVHFTLVHWYLLNRSLFLSVPKAMLYIAYWLGLLGVSFVIWRAIEKPSQRWIRSCFGSKRNPMPERSETPGSLSR